MFLEISQNSEESTCARVSLNKKVAGLQQVFCSEFSEMFKNNFTYRTPRAVASGLSLSFLNIMLEIRLRLLIITLIFFLAFISLFS